MINGSVGRKEFFVNLFVIMILTITFPMYKLHLFVFPIWYEEKIVTIIIKYALIDATIVLVYLLSLIKLIKSIPARIMYVANQRAERENEKRRESVERMRQELLANISHDLRTPLTSIISYIEILKGEKLDGPAAEYVDIIDKKADALRRMVDDVVYLSKLTSKTMEVKSEQINIKRLLEQALCEWRVGDEGNSHSINVVFNGEEMCIETDGSKLYRVLQNLYDNAVKYSRQGTGIDIEYTCTDGKKVIIEMRNEASYPMPFEGKDMIGRFVRADRARNSAGHGLGLAITEELMELCGGEMKIEIREPYFIVDLIFDTPG